MSEQQETRRSSVCPTCRGTRKVYPGRDMVVLDTVPGYDPRVPCPDCGEIRRSDVEPLDPIEREYVRAMNSTLDSDRTLELSIGLNQYQTMFKERDALRAWLKTALAYIPTDTDDELDAPVREEIASLLDNSPANPEATDV